MKKIRLKCNFGGKNPEDVIEVKDELADSLILEGHAVLELDAEVLGDSKEVAMLKEAVATKNEEIEALTAMLKEAVELPKGQKPAGFKKV